MNEQELHRITVEEQQVLYRFGFEWHRTADWNFDSHLIPSTAFWYIISGERQLILQGQYYDLKPGDLITLPAGAIVTTRFLKNAPEPIHYLALGLDIRMYGLEWTALYDVPMHIPLQLEGDSRLDLLREWRQVLQASDGVMNMLHKRSDPHRSAELSELLLAFEGQYKLLFASLSRLLRPYMINPNPVIDARVSRMCDYLRGKCMGAVSMQELAEEMNLSEGHMRELFRASVGCSPYQYVLLQRMEKAKELLLTTTLSISQIASSIGFEDHSHFAKLFRERTGMTPGRYRKSSSMAEGF
ncbi:AraC family transcriptional regulator [Paenibacillus sp. HB172176]|uniref:AraC family transcriptional regulator n=1 Tax=Paenibacillus sp. HB172176 TaxID=2493690 RepID=UPI0014395258|nr:AraC family transcriptional regulator [Paenibacillus sp. HB172176]